MNIVKAGRMFYNFFLFRYRIHKHRVTVNVKLTQSQSKNWFEIDVDTWLLILCFLNVSDWEYAYVKFYF